MKEGDFIGQQTAEEEPKDTKPKIRPETKLKGSVAEQINKAIEKLGRENVLGPKEVEKTFSVRLEEVPGIPFSVEELERAGELGQILVLRVDKTADGKPMSLEAMDAIVGARWEREGKGKLLAGITPRPVEDNKIWTGESDKMRTGAEIWKSILGENFSKDAPCLGWVLDSKDLLPESTNKTCIEQMETLINYLQDKVFKGMEIPKEYVKAIAEFESKKEGLIKLAKDDWRSFDKQIAALEITQLTHRTIQEIAYDLALYYDNNNKRLLTDKWARSLTPLYEDFELASLGGFDVNGISTRSLLPSDESKPNLGVSLSRKL